MDGTLIPEVKNLITLACAIVVLFGGVSVCLALLVDQLAEGLAL